jgi:hypothetical protein
MRPQPQVVSDGKIQGHKDTTWRNIGVTVAASYLAAQVTTWPRGGVALLIIVVVLLVIAGIVANMTQVSSKEVAAPPPPLEPLDAISPPLAEAEDREYEEVHNV